MIPSNPARSIALADEVLERGIANALTLLPSA
jgi:hypothetical protein